MGEILSATPIYTHTSVLFYLNVFCPVPFHWGVLVHLALRSLIFKTQPIREVSALNGQKDGKQWHCPVDISLQMVENTDSPIRCWPWYSFTLSQPGHIREACLRVTNSGTLHIHLRPDTKTLLTPSQTLLHNLFQSWLSHIKNSFFPFWEKVFEPGSLTLSGALSDTQWKAQYLSSRPGDAVRVA